MHENKGTSRAVSQRVRAAQENIIGNEALGETLDEAAASEMMSWGLKSAAGIASSTEGMDEESADLSIADRLKSLRKLMRHLGRLLGEGMSLDDEGRLWLWNSVQEHARMLYGERLQLPQLEELMGRLSQGEPPRQIIVSLRRMFESQTDE